MSDLRYEFLMSQITPIRDIQDNEKTQLNLVQYAGCQGVALLRWDPLENTMCLETVHYDACRTYKVSRDLKVDEYRYIPPYGEDPNLEFAGSVYNCFAYTSENRAIYNDGVHLYFVAGDGGDVCLFSFDGAKFEKLMCISDYEGFDRIDTHTNLCVTDEALYLYNASKSMLMKFER